MNDDSNFLRNQNSLLCNCIDNSFSGLASQINSFFCVVIGHSWSLFILCACWIPKMWLSWLIRALIFEGCYLWKCSSRVIVPKSSTMCLYIDKFVWVSWMGLKSGKPHAPPLYLGTSNIRGEKWLFSHDLFCPFLFFIFYLKPVKCLHDSEDSCLGYHDACMISHFLMFLLLDVSDVSMIIT